MWLFLLMLIIEAAILVTSVVVYTRRRDWFALFVLIADICAIVGTYFSRYEDFPWTTEIYSFAQVKYSATEYNEGNYYGGWEDEYPQGKGRLTYRHFVDNRFYAITDEAGRHKALYYEGEFDKGWRVGQGVMVYDGDYKDVGTFYGKWEAGKLVFEGTRWKDDKYYLPLRIFARDSVSADDRYGTDHWLVK